MAGWRSARCWRPWCCRRGSLPCGGLQTLSPAAYATPLGLHPDIRPSTFSVATGDRLVCCTDGLLEARDRAGQYQPVTPGPAALTWPLPAWAGKAANGRRAPAGRR